MNTLKNLHEPKKYDVVWIVGKVVKETICYNIPVGLAHYKKGVASKSGMYNNGIVALRINGTDKIIYN